MLERSGRSLPYTRWVVSESVPGMRRGGKRETLVMRQVRAISRDGQLQSSWTLCYSLPPSRKILHCAQNNCPPKQSLFSTFHRIQWLCGCVGVSRGTYQLRNAGSGGASMANSIRALAELPPRKSGLSHPRN